ncbi:microneme protein MIC1 [Besnoitia besnoiti]|uniref:Microneme protein MIC1 n=1 Tax=Besnoitia besnoiti TaxID=94643 RepID=A0A2A9M1X6_BESBE|nr:microneme protein MIC1 [Besnoitia besnoiti]PFH31969.1 microneme protein MIC1 [Besnoitia besnoiti]
MKQSRPCAIFLSVLFGLGGLPQGRAFSPSPSARSLQEVLDERCREFFVEACKGGLHETCGQDIDVVARKGLGRPFQPTHEWRCYKASVLLPEAETNNFLTCVDNCGAEIQCSGGVDWQKTVHVTRHDELSTLIQETIPLFCSPYQAAANKFCQASFAGTVARKTKGFGDDDPIIWRCYEPGSLLFSIYGECISNCGHSWSCPGGRAGTRTDLDRQHYTLQASILDVIATVEEPCSSEDVCLPTDQNPPACVDRNGRRAGPEESAVNAATSLQAALDARCQEFFAERCKEGDDQTCGEDSKVVARRGRGLPNQPTHEWRCYEASILLAEDEEDNFLTCVDNCGVEIRCEGAVDPSTTVHVTRNKALTALIEEMKPRFCSPYQAAANKFCQASFAGTVARKTKGLRDEDRVAWRCYDPKKLLFSVDASCVSNCGDVESCPGGRKGTSTELDGQHLSHDINIRKAIEAVKDPCPAGQRCFRTEQNPPECVAEDKHLIMGNKGSQVGPESEKSTEDETTADTDDYELLKKGRESEERDRQEQQGTDDQTAGDSDEGVFNAAGVKDVDSHRAHLPGGQTVADDKADMQLKQGEQLVLGVESPALNVTIGSCDQFTVNISESVLSIAGGSQSEAITYPLEGAIGRAIFTVGLGNAGRIGVTLKYGIDTGYTRSLGYVLENSVCGSSADVSFHDIGSGATLVRLPVGENRVAA